jgi:hypothetical protein
MVKVVVEDIETTLVQDATYEQFRSLVYSGQPWAGRPVKATVVGRFYTGLLTERGDRTDFIGGGFGNLSASMLIVIQQVLAVGAP